MTQDYAYDHAWTQERVRLAGLEAALDPGTHQHLTRLGAGPGWRCLEIGAGGGAVAFWLAERVGPDGVVVATDLETDFLEVEAARHRCLEVLRHDITTEDLPTGFDLVHARWLVEWLPDKRQALTRMVAALVPGGVLIVEEPDFVTIFETAEPPALRRVMTLGMRHLETTCPVEVEYGRRALDDLTAVGLINVEAEGRCPIVRGGSPPAADFLRLTLEKLRVPLLEAGTVTEAEFDEAVAALENPSVTVVMPMTVAAWGWRAST
jgi:SAM-dependent methyltransferase